MILAQLIRDVFVRKKDRHKFPLYYVLLAGIAGLLPDIDVVFYWVFYWVGWPLSEVHRTFSHTIFVPLVFILLGLIATNWDGKKFLNRNFKWNYVFYILAFGTFVHMILDATIAGYIMPLYPLTSFAIGLNLINLLPEVLRGLFLPSLDAAVLVLWLIYLEFKHKVSSFV